MNSTKEVIEQIVSRLDIVDLISEYVVLKKAGATYTGLCPFHQEKTPSFRVNREKQIFKCFGCGAGGNSFEFYKKYHSLDFKDALREMANKTGVELDFKDYNKDEYNKKENLKKSIFEIYEKTLEFYRWNFNNPDYGLEAQAYVKQRKIHPNMVEKFMIGYSQNNWESLYRYLSNKGFEQEVLKESGLFIERENGKGFYDRFRNRVMFPIQDENGKVIAFGARTLANEPAKYINSPESIIYTKGNHLYGLNFAKNKIKELDFTILAEGYLDVISCHEAGFENSVASLGTALTPEQSKKILRYSSGKKVVIAYDSDNAGQRATEKGIEVLEDVSKGTGIEIYILSIPSGKDPDEFIHTEGYEAFANVVNDSKPILEFQIESALKKDISTPENKAKAIDECIKVLTKIDNDIYKTEMIKKIVNWTNSGLKIDIREEDIRRRLKLLSEGKEEYYRTNYYPKNNFNKFNPNNKFQNNNGFKKNYYNNYQQTKPFSDKAIVEFEKNPSALQAEMGLIYFMMERYRALHYIKTKIENVVFQDSVNEELKNKIFEIGSIEKQLKWEELLNYFIQFSDFQSRITEIWESYSHIDISSDKILKDYIKHVRMNFFKLQRDEIKHDIDIAIRSGNRELIKSLMEAYSEIQVKLKKMESDVNIA